MMGADEATAHPDPRVRPGICGITTKTGATEWVCIREPHDTEKQRSNQLYGAGYPPQHLRHHFVNRWPNRPRPDASE